MTEAAPDGGARRRLPSWILGAAVADADKSSKSDNGDEKNKVPEEGAAPCRSKTKKGRGISAVPLGNENLGTRSDNHLRGEREFAPGRDKTKRQRKKEALPQEDQTLRTSSHVYLNGERKRSKRTLVQKDIEFDAAPASTREKDNGLGRTAQKSSSLRAKTNVQGDGSSEKKEILSAGYEDGELTVEDLVTIAKEYLKDNKDVKQQESSVRECEIEMEGETLKTDFSSYEFVKAVVCHDSDAGVSTHETTINDSTEDVRSEQIIGSSTRTGDLAQDMLDLLLGPLLKKPVEEKRTEMIMKDTGFKTEIGIQSQSDAREEIAPSMKMQKKSLRDKVALLLE